MEITDFSGSLGEYFKPANHKDAVAILAQPTAFTPNVPTKRFGPKDEITADLTIFADNLALDSHAPDVIEGAKIQQAALVKALQPYVGKAVIIRLDQVDTGKGNPAWVFVPVDKETKEKVVAYVQAREAELEDCPI